MRANESQSRAWAAPTVHGLPSIDARVNVYAEDLPMAKKKATKKARKKTTRTKQASATGGATRAKRAPKGPAGTNGPPGTRTILYVHGIGNKPTAEILKCQWDEALFGFNLGERSRLAYWVNRITYPTPRQAGCEAPDLTTAGTPDDASGFSVRAMEDPTPAPEQLLPAEADEIESREALTRIALEALEPPSLGKLSAADVHARVLPLPKPLRTFISRRITKAFLKDVHEFLFVPERRELMRESVMSRLRSGGGPFVLIGHSQGSLIAYEALSALTAKDGIEIDLFVTIGSPLGLKEVQDQLETMTGQRRLAVPAVVKRWINVSDPLDPVCADKRLGNDYRATNGVNVEDFVCWNMDSPRDPHSGSGYLRLHEVRAPVREIVDRALFQRISSFTIARDLVNDMEMGDPPERHSVLIELRNEWRDDASPAPASEVREAIVEWIKTSIAQADPPLDEEAVDLEPLSTYVSAKLTRSEIERLTDELRLTAVYRVFKNARKRALLDESIECLQCATAHRGYNALGKGILWAVLDSGIDPHHPHFTVGEKNIEAVFDCLRTGPVRQWTSKSKTLGVDRNGHGTHVAGIVAGGIPELEISGLAPHARLRSYKVLDDDGVGSDAKIIKALDHIYETNRNSATLVIHGVNLSLGGAFDPESFGCGDTPLCKELRKLWRQGVVVVLAAGNEGYLELQQGDDIVGLNTDLSIGDPANLDEAIAVGSIHKTKPHMYGVSYFSSRGPTADGRCKPDVVAPGERVVSCRAGAPPGTLTRKNLYVAMSGTSMAAPHVSGLIASFLSARKEFIGYPDRVKQLLLEACTDLKRDRNHQGAGMPNLVKMLLIT